MVPHQLFFFFSLFVWGGLGFSLPPCDIKNLNFTLLQLASFNLQDIWATFVILKGYSGE